MRTSQNDHMAVFLRGRGQRIACFCTRGGGEMTTRRNQRPSMCSTMPLPPTMPQQSKIPLYHIPKQRRGRYCQIRTFTPSHALYFFSFDPSGCTLIILSPTSQIKRHRHVNYVARKKDQQWSKVMRERDKLLNAKDKAIEV